MERLAIIDKDTHTLIIDEVSDEVLKRYNNSEEAYIEDTYNFEEGYIWDFIVNAEYYTCYEGDPITIDFDKIKKEYEG